MDNTFSWSWAEDPAESNEPEENINLSSIIGTPECQLFMDIAELKSPLLIEQDWVFDAHFFQFKLPDDCLDLDFHSFWSILFNLDDISLISEWFSFISNHSTFDFKATEGIISEQFHNALESGSFLGSRHTIISHFFHFFPLSSKNQRPFNGNSFALSLFQSLNDFDVQYHHEDFFYPTLKTLMECEVPPGIRNHFGESVLSKLNQLLGQIRLTLPNPLLEKDLFQCAQLIIELTGGDSNQFRVLPPIDRIVEHEDLLHFYHTFIEKQNLLSTISNTELNPSNSTHLLQEDLSFSKKTKRL